MKALKSQAMHAALISTACVLIVSAILLGVAVLIGSSKPTKPKPQPLSKQYPQVRLVYQDSQTRCFVFREPPAAPAFACVVGSAR